MGYSMEPTSTSGASIIGLLKMLALPVTFAGLAALVGILIVPPKTVAESIRRIIVTMVCGVIFGYPLRDYLLANYAFVNATYDGLIFVCAGLPAWWALGLLARFGEKNADSIAHKLAAKLGLLKKD